MNVFEHDVAVSAVRYDALLVAEIVKRLAPALGSPVLSTARAETDPAASPPVTQSGDARVVLVVLHPLWSQDASTDADRVALRQRMRRRPKSVVVLTIGDAVVPEWLQAAARHDLRTEGLDPLVERVLACVVAQGGVVAEVAPVVVVPRTTPPGFDLPPFLEQARAQSTLRHELDALFTTIESRLDARNTSEDRTVELSSLPNRCIARHGEHAISFSWLGGRLGGIVDGRLLVIEWTGVAPSQRGVAVLKSANRGRETAYAAEARDAQSWCWRDGAPHGRACSTINLVDEWFDTVLAQQA